MNPPWRATAGWKCPGAGYGPGAAELAVEPRTNTPQEFRALLETDVRRWAQVVKAAGIKIE